MALPMIDITAYSRGLDSDPGWLSSSATRIFSDKYIEIFAEGFLSANQVFSSDEIVCVLAGRVPKTCSAESVARDYLRFGERHALDLAGSFITILYSPLDKCLVVYRDIAGLQHGYYWYSQNHFVFSTALKWVLSVCSEYFGVAHRISELGLAYYLTFQYLPSPHTMFENVFQLAPAAQLCTSIDRQLKVQNYTVFPSANTEPLEGTLEQHTINVYNLVLRSLRRQINIDHKTAAFLSGGMDTSTVIALLVNEFDIRPLAFTATFDNEEYDELRYAKIVSDYFGLEHLTVLIEPALVKHLPEMVKLYENPLGDQSVFAEYSLCSAIQAHGCLQLVTGEGGDELLGPPRSRDSKEVFEDLPASIDDLASFYLELTSVSSFQARTHMLNFLGASKNCGHSYLVELYSHYSQREAFEKLYFGQWKTWLIEDVYMKDIQVATHFCISPVLPFASAELMDYLSRLTPSDRRVGVTDKKFLRESMRDRLPREILNKPKHKFWIPFRQWFRNEWYGYLHETLLEVDSAVCSWYGRSSIETLVKEHKSTEADHYRILWALLFLENWYHEFAEPWL